MMLIASGYILFYQFRSFIMFKSLLFITLLACTLSMNAQKVSFGLTGSLGVVSLNASSDDIKPKLGGAGGGVMLIPINPTFGIQLEGIFSIKGCNTSSDLVFNTLNFDIPILAKLTFDENAIFLGPYLGFNIVGSIDTDEEKGMKVDNLNSFDYGLVIGYERHITKNLYLNIRFNYGLADVLENVANSDNFESGKHIGGMLGAIFYFK